MKINEIFGITIQGEGKTAGKPVMFLRLSGCNLHCVWCDTPYTWNWEGTSFSHPSKFKKEDERFEKTDEEIISELKKLGGDFVKALVISGGEPLIQQKQLITLVTKLKEENWWVEVETNGTIKPSDELMEQVDQFNCSPKLSNSDNDFKSRVRKIAMEALTQSPKVYFKFVIANETDEKEVEDYINTFNLNIENIFLMPLGMTKEELNCSREATQRLAKKMGIEYSERLHITLLGGGRGL